MTRLFWGGGRARPAVVAGVLVATYLFVVTADARSIPGAAINAMVIGAGVGLGVVWDQRDRWPAGQALDRMERSEVVGLVLRGEGARDRRLAPAVIEFAQVQRKAADSRYKKWLLFVSTAAVAAGACFEAVEGHPVTAVCVGLLAVLLVVASVGRGTRSARRRSHAERAETAARALLDTSDHPGATR